LHGDDEIEIFGNDYATHDGTAVRDYIHVNDLAMAHVYAVNELKKGIGNTILNLGIGKGYSVMEVFDCIGEVLGKPVPYFFGDRRPGDPEVLVADSSKAKEILKWEPVYIELNKIIETACNWHSNGKVKVR